MVLVEFTEARGVEGEDEIESADVVVSSKRGVGMLLGSSAGATLTGTDGGGDEGVVCVLVELELFKKRANGNRSRGCTRLAGIGLIGGLPTTMLPTDHGLLL